MDKMSNNKSNKNEGAIIIVAKCPIPGMSKTRLIPLLGEQGSSTLSKAMLCDVLVSLVNHEPLKRVTKILYFAPGNDEGRHCMQTILDEMKIPGGSVTLLPMIVSEDLLVKPDLGDQLKYVLNQVKKTFTTGPVLFLGSDSPELPLEEITEALLLGGSENDYQSNNKKQAVAATICPSQDGGYGMLCIPNTCPEDIFDDMLWSHPLTALAQIKCLTDAGMDVRLGRIMHDIDEPDDVQELVRKIQLTTTTCSSQNDTNNYKILDRSSSPSKIRNNGKFEYTQKALKDLKMI